MNLIIVEDSIYVRDKIKKLLKPLNNITITGFYDDAHVAFDAIASSNPNLILTDIFIRNGSGIEMILNVKKQFPHIKIIVYTNYAIPYFQKKCECAGVEYFLDKSEEFDKILDIMKNLFPD